MASKILCVSAVLLAVIALTSAFPGPGPNQGSAAPARLVRETDAKSEEKDLKAENSWGYGYYGGYGGPWGGPYAGGWGGYGYGGYGYPYGYAYGYPYGYGYGYPFYR